jgi:SLT domain-containing protein
LPDRSLGFNITALDQASKTFVKLGQTVEKLERKLHDLDKTKADPQVDVDTRRAEQKIGAFASGMQRRLTAAIKALPDVEIGADSSQADRRIAAIRRELVALSDKRIGIDIDAGTAQAQVQRLRDELNRLGASSPNVQVRADTAAASAALAVVSRQASSLDRQDVSIGVSVQGITRGILMMGLLTSGIAAVGAAAPAAAAALAAIPAAAGAAGQGIGALAAGFAGIGDAVDALADVEADAARTSASSAATRVAAAERIASAQRSLQDAQIAADRAAIAGAQRVADARRALADAERDASDAARRAADDVVAARERLVDAGTAVVRAEADLHEARRQAIRDLQDLSEQVSDSALTIEGAEISLARAQERQREINANAAASALDRREAALRVAQAQDRLSDAHREARRDQEALTEAERRGVSANRNVLAAKFRLNDAEQAHRQALAGVQQALVDQTRTQQESARKIADARRDVARAEQQAAFARQDAARRIEDAQRQLATAMATTTAAAAKSSAAQDKLTEAMAKLSPAGRDFARFLHGQIIPGLRGIGHAVQETLLPRMQQSMSNLLTIAPLLSAGLADTGRVIGDLSVAGSEMMTSGPWREDFPRIMAANNRILEDFGLASLSLVDAFRSITVEAQPMLERLSQFTQRISDSFAAWIEGRRQSGDLAAWFSEMGDRLAQLGAVLADVAVGAWNLSQALGPMGMVILETIGNTVEMIGEFAKAHPTLTQFAAGGLLVYSSFISLGKLFAGIGAASTLAVSGFRKFGAAAALIVPANLETKLSTMLGLVDANGFATQRAATRTGRFAGAVSRAASTLPALGLAVGAVAITYDKVVISAGEAADAINAGGEEAEKARQRIDVLERGTEGWLSFLRPLITTQEEATAAAREQYDALGPLARAQQDLSKLQADYDEVLRDHPPNSDAAKDAAERLRQAQKALQWQQEATAEATKSHTERLIDQQTQMMGMADTDLAFRQSVLATEEAQRRAAEAVAEYGARSQEARGATLGVEQAMLRQIAAAGENARAQWANKDSVDANAAAMRAENGELLNLIAAAGTNAPPALLELAGKMDKSALSAHGAFIRTDEFGNRVLHLPNGKAVRISAPGAVQARDEVDALALALRNLPKTTTADVLIRQNIQGTGPSNTRNAPGLVGRAHGGPVRGSGSETSDSILARLSDEEHVWTAREVRGAGGHDRVERLRGLAEDGRLPAFAAGGPVRVRMGSVSDAVWQQLLGMGYRGDPTDRMEALYVPREVLRSVQAYQRQLEGLGGTARSVVSRGLAPLVESVLSSGETIQDTWDENTASVEAAQRLQSRLFALLASALGSSTAGMAGHIGSLQASSNRSWADMRTRTGAEVDTITGRQFGQLSQGLRFAQDRTVATQVATNRAWTIMRDHTGTETRRITGPIFGGLHRGMDAIAGHGERMSGAFRDIMGRIRAYTADPIRWSLQWPINRGLQPAWAEIDRFFALNRPWGGVPIGFATGGRVFGAGTETSDSVPARLSRDEHVWTAREVRGAGGHDEMTRMRRAAAQGDLALFAQGGPVLPGFAVGGGVQFGSRVDRAMAAIIQRAIPSARVSSAFRPGDSGYHGRGKAIDIGAPEAASNRWIARRYPNSTQLIYTPGVNLLHGRPHTYNPSTRAQHYCVPLDVPILTRRGWLTYDQVVEGDETPGFNFDTQQTEWTAVTAIHTYDDAEVVEAASRSWSVRTTPGHRWIARDSETGRHHWTTTDSGSRWPWRVAAPMADGPGVDLTDDEAELLGWLITDGSQWEASDTCSYSECTNPPRAKGLCGSHRRQQRKGQHLHALRAGWPDGAVADFSLFVWQTKPTGVARLAEILGDKAAWNRKGYRLRDAYARDLLRRADLDNIRNPDQLLTLIAAMTAAQRTAMLAGVVGGDGTAGHTGARGKTIGQRILQDDGPLVDVLSTLAYYCGHRVRVSKRDPGSGGYDSDGVHMTISLAQPFVSTQRQGRRSLGHMRVWCPTTELGTWTAQFDRSPVLTGNSHTHWAMENMAMLGGRQGVGSMGAYDPRSMIEPYFRETRRLIGDIGRFHGRGNVATAMTRMGNDSVAGAIADAQRRMAVMGPGPGSGVQRWRGVGQRALAIARQPASEWPRMAMQMQSESGGDPRAVNRWDVNWQRGHPSVGLMQVIGPTYRTHKHPQFDTGPYLYGTSVNPLSNILASTRYTLARYGSLARGWRGVGYDDGGMLKHGMGGWNLSGRPERVLSPRQTDAFERLVRVLETRHVPRAVSPMVAAGVRSGDGGVGAAVEKHYHYHLTAYEAGNNRIDLQTQFRRLELQSGIGT